MNDNTPDAPRLVRTSASLTASSGPVPYLAVSGFLFVVVALAALTAMGYFLSIAQLTPFDFTRVAANETQSRVVAQIVSNYLPAVIKPILMFLVAVLSSILGFSMMQVSSRATRHVIPPEDRELVSELLLTFNEVGIHYYIKLSALTGVIGAFTKLDLSGLPLATIALTIIFALMALVSLGSETSKSLLDLAKLSLGAFIGSYVQRQQGPITPGETGAPRGLAKLPPPATGAPDEVPKPTQKPTLADGPGGVGGIK